MNGCYEKMTDLLMNKSGKVYFYIDYSQNEWFIANQSAAPECMISERYNPVEAILNSGKITEEDRGLYGDFAGKLYAGTLSCIADIKLKIQFRLNVSDTEQVWYSMELLLGKADDGRITETAGQLYKMSEREIMDRNILHFYTNDRNPWIFASLIENRIKNDRKNNYAFIQFDVVKFKLINDTYGEPIGTELLHHFNDVLSVYCNETQLFSRLSADVFMVVTPYNDIEDIYRFIKGLEKRLSGYNGMKYSFAFGVYLVEDRSVPSRIMGDSAGIARSQIKGNALENIGFYNDSQKKLLKSKKIIEDKMKTALENGEFLMYLQPKYSISDNTIIGAEALVRWNQPGSGIISPSEFIPIFEQNGFIIKLDEYIWECACKLLHKWIELGYKPVPISVNVSRVHLKNTDFIDNIEALVKKYDIPKSMLELEITETIENINANAMVKAAKKHGFTLLMDDFGSGYSSLNTLKSTPFDVLKIDRSFLSSFMESERGQKIISHTIAMSKDIGLGLIAEGVETAEQANFLCDCGCNAAQGFYYSKAIPIEDFERLIEEEQKQKEATS